MCIVEALAGIDAALHVNGFLDDFYGPIFIYVANVKHCKGLAFCSINKSIFIASKWSLSQPIWWKRCGDTVRTMLEEMMWLNKATEGPDKAVQLLLFKRYLQMTNHGE